MPHTMRVVRDQVWSLTGTTHSDSGGANVSSGIRLIPNGQTVAALIQVNQHPSGLSANATISQALVVILNQLLPS